jgi:hypothetical protein
MGERAIRTERSGAWIITTWSDGSKTFGVPKEKIIKRFRIAPRSRAAAALLGQRLRHLLDYGIQSHDKLNNS